MSSIKQTARKVVGLGFESIGWSIARRVAANGPGIPFLEILTEQRYALDGGGTLLQIGANDGVMADPVHELITKLQMPAILVEPLPDKFRDLCANYSGVPGIHFHNVAVSTKSGEAELFRFSQAAPDLPSWTQGLASFDRNVLLKHKSTMGAHQAKIEDLIESVRVPVLTIADILAKHRELPEVLALQIDTEGHDFNVVKSAIDANCLPPIINYEHKHLSYQDQFDCRALLATKNYGFFSSAADTLAYRLN